MLQKEKKLKKECGEVVEVIFTSAATEQMKKYEQIKKGCRHPAYTSVPALIYNAN